MGTPAYLAPEQAMDAHTVDVRAETEIVLVFKGDASLDGKVNTRDGLAIKKHAAGTETLDGVALLAGNTNGDANTNMRDVLAIKKQVAGTDYIAW